MLLLFAHLLTAALGVAAQYPARPRAPGVAFRLTPDYGIAVIYFNDGTTVPVAQVHGSRQYRVFMRNNTASASTEDSMLCRFLPPALERLPPAFRPDLDICRGTDFTSTKALLATLKSAVESYLGTNICFAGLSLDGVEEHTRDIAQEALQALGLRQVIPTVQPARYAVHANRPDSEPAYDEDPWVVLAVDYSFHWFDVGVYTIDEIGLVLPVHSTVRGPRIGEENQLDALRDTLNSLFANPPPDFNLPAQFRYLVVYGDDAKNETLHHMLKDILGSDLVRDARVSSSVFDGMAFMAHVVHEHMDTIDFETQVESAFGCKWRSKLYPKDESEL
ncbi:hypothetical protein CC80DRAFT_491094 [Byssothecium circinans]|uniref:Uncharacterized protein n=1 Tax=Byssothecium circinans TaxID=147558 RepID=A0A6A5U194_9PLEO|nr:hypothetical protein CC80DRAFT_491094 [Byssothecium circinans]